MIINNQESNKYSPDGYFIIGKTLSFDGAVNSVNMLKLTSDRILIIKEGEKVRN